ncbi:hypothetical protein H5410_049339 [Solanum commersonii]|uniref:Uncharacterized protein n=1 Tax=Solanum commersonii TaxID=4109 RepID=A0A9J5WUP9_SOLCO|nr:hypothetical protein H5410_049339 [Solanum commersonii]
MFGLRRRGQFAARDIARSEPSERSLSKPAKKNDPRTHFKHLREMPAHRVPHSRPRRAHPHACRATNELGVESAKEYKN